MYRFFDRSRENLSRGGARDYGRDSLGLRDGSEMVVSDACVKGKDKINIYALWVEPMLYILCFYSRLCFSVLNFCFNLPNSS